MSVARPPMASIPGPADVISRGSNGSFNGRRNANRGVLGQGKFRRAAGGIPRHRHQPRRHRGQGPRHRRRERHGADRRRPQIRGPRGTEGILPAGQAGGDQSRRHRRGLPRADGRQERRRPALAREGSPRGGLDAAGEAVPEERARHRHHLRAGEGRLHCRPQRRRGVPAGQPGRHPSRPRHHPALGHAAAVPDPEDGPLARQHRGLAPRRARGEPRRGALRAGRQSAGRPDPPGRGEEHHRLRRLR